MMNYFRTNLKIMNMITIRRMAPATDIPAMIPDESPFLSVASGELFRTGTELVLVSEFCEFPPLFEKVEVMVWLGLSAPSGPSGIIVDTEAELVSGEDSAVVTSLGPSVSKAVGVLLGELSDVRVVSGVSGVVVGGRGEEVTEGILLGVLLGIFGGDEEGVVAVLVSEIHVVPSSTGFNLSNDVGGTRLNSQVTHLDSYEGSHGFS